MLTSRSSAVARRAIPLVLVGAGLAAYANSFRGAFLLDDVRRIVDNPQIRHLWPPWPVIAGTSRPFVQLSLALNYAFGGLNVWGYHAFNLAVHLLAGLTLFALVGRMLQSPALRPRYGQTAPWLAMVVALLWLLHPLQTESVTYIIQRAESLAGLFLLLTLYCALRGAHSPSPRAWYAAAILACALGMGSKEGMIVAPLLILLYDRLVLADSFRQLLRQRWGLYTGLAATWLVLGALLATSPVEEQTVLVAGLTPWRYALTQFGVILHYLRLSVWPHPLILDYTWPLADNVPAVLPAATAVLALLAGTIWALYRQAWLGFWGAWFFLILAPTSSLFPLGDVAFEHRMYLPLAAVVLLVAIGAHEAIGFLVRRNGGQTTLRRGLELTLAVAAVAALGAATARRNVDYRSPVAMWSDTVAKRPDNPRAHNNLAIELNRVGRTEEATTHFFEAVRFKPDFAEAHNNLGGALLGRGQIEEAMAHLSEAVRLKPGYAEAHYNLGSALAKQGRTQQAIAHFSRAIRLKPDYPEAHSSLGSALAREGRAQEAIAHFSQALRLKPDSPEVQNSLGNALYLQGQIRESVAWYSAALRLKPDYAEVHHNLGLALVEQGDIREAIAHFSEAVHLKPDYAKAHNNLGTLLYQQGRIKEAIAHFSDAVRLEPDSTNALNNLRAAQASLQHAKEKR